MLDVIKTFANKTSTDYNGLNMFFLNTITNLNVDPLLHVCNIPFSKGVFPDAMSLGGSPIIQIRGQTRVY